MEERIEVAVVGGGQAGLSVSHELTRLGIEHVVLERGRLGQTWRGRWDSFCLVTPNWSVQLPGGAYAGDDPDGFMPRDDVVDHLETYARSFRAPVREGVEVTALRAGRDRGFVLRTSMGELSAASVVLAAGAYQRPHRPHGASLPDALLQIDADDYRSPAALPDGGVLVVGSGQTGCQLAEELHEAGREVVLACGRAPWFPRRAGDRDVFDWALRTGFMDVRADALPSPEARLVANIQATGHGGGHDLHYRVLQEMGVTLAGRLLGVDDGRAILAPDLADSVAFGDARHREFRDLILGTCSTLGLPAPRIPDPDRFVSRSPEAVELSGLGAVIFTAGFRPDYARWVQLDAFDGMGFPLQRDGASTAVPGLYFCGVHFLRKRRSSLLAGVGEDARIVAEQVARSSRRDARAGASRG